MHNKLKILLVDDEEDVLEFMQYNLQKNGYEVFIANNGLMAIDVATMFHPDLIVLDLMMPKLDGIYNCRELRKREEFKNTIIIFLTARDEDYTEITSFEAGADDYITKPIKPKVFISRIKGLLRRVQVEAVNEIIQLQDITIDKTRYVIIKNDVEISLPKKEFELLSLLASKPGKVFTRDEILNKVWGNETIVGDRTIDVHIRKIREKLGDNSIKTIKGVGYKFDA